MAGEVQEIALVARRIESWDWCGVAATEVGLVSATLAHASEAACMDALRAASTAARHRSRGAQRLHARRLAESPVAAAGWSAHQIAGNGLEQLWEYLTTGRQRLEIPLDRRAGTEFQQRTWDVLRKIPFGEVESYRWVASELAQPRATRAVGTAIGANELLVFVPCHRVVAARGLGGYSRGLDVKRRLLAHERSWPRTAPLFVG
ncbi:MAG: methylated-DNA--[protein]-cysteine S-methyltransferase [Chloroflexota bacterium]|nr:methylated-DNA--[protein]-cysteine S-methyltransferase [Chloroflexota bacterium]MDE2918285.1 methylated-DNA--[protein]-cysteine S-methyltransferase [Chloroflexota bacterium]